MGGKLICKICLLEKMISCFLNEKTGMRGICYKCVYRIKCSVKKQKRCRICKNVNKSTRAVYCSDECASIGEKQIRSAHWTRKMTGYGHVEWRSFNIKSIP